jgi:hypothetical protein
MNTLSCFSRRLSAFNPLHVLLFSVLLLTTACGTSRISSNKSPDFNDKLTKIYLLVKAGKGTTSFAQQFQDAFFAELAKRNIATDGYIVQPLALESDEDIHKKIEKFNPQVLMIMQQTQAERYAGVGMNSIYAQNNVNGATFDIKLLLPGSDKPVWRASLESHGDYGILAAVNKSVKRLIDELTQDGLL